MSYQHTQPADIEQTSMKLIAEELAQRGIVIPHEQDAVVRRVIHTTADFDYAQNLTFTPNAVALGVEVLQKKAPIVTDTNMALAGISKPGLKKLETTAACYMADARIAAQAKQEGTTRAVAAMKYAAEKYPHAVFAIGNAPTALIELEQLISQGLRPALIIAVPVGFVNVVESKQEIYAACLRHNVPAIVAMGRKGGSNVAAAICNALIYTALNQLDPHTRG